MASNVIFSVFFLYFILRPFSTSSHCRIADLDLANVWALANVTKNAQLVEICIPHIERQFENVTGDRRFLRHTEINYLEELLVNISSDHVTEEAKLKSITAWINTPNSDNAGFNERERFYNSLLSTLNIDNFSKDFIIDVALDQSNFELPSSYKATLVNTWLKGQTSDSKPQPSTSSPTSNRYDLPVFLI